MKRSLAALSVMAIALLSHSPIAPAAADEVSNAPEISRVVLEEEQTPGVVSDVTITFDNPADSTEVEGQLEAIFQEPTTLEISGGTAYEEGAPSQPVTSTGAFKAANARDDVSYGDKVIRCDQYYPLSNSYGTFTIQRACGVQVAPWGYFLSASMRSLCTSDVSETGMRWTNNGVNQPAGASHLYPDYSTFHGSFNGHSGVKAGDNVDYYDYFACRHSINGGGDVLLRIFGTLRFRAAA